MHVQNVHTMDELKLTGNCLKGSRGILSFDEAFDATESGRLIKELFIHVCLADLFSGTGLMPLGLRRTSRSSPRKTFYRSCSDIFHARLEDLVPQFSG